MCVCVYSDAESDIKSGEMGLGQCDGCVCVYSDAESDIKSGEMGLGQCDGCVCVYSDAESDIKSGEMGLGQCDGCVCVYSDAESDIKSGEMGLGMSRRDTYLLDWVSVDNHTHITKQFKITDGVPTWVKMRVTNNGALKPLSYSAATGHQLDI